ncbi:MAG: ribbon-helix-helix domain-containing protein [Chloroflexi bacterium]|nr:ribbon-helix-helix domain-containing protein [Chloroflexota bacterium]
MVAITKKPLQVYLRLQQLEPLRALAKRRGVPISELVRQGVDKVLAEVPPEEDPLWDIVGIGGTDEGPTDVAERHDEYLVKWEYEANHPDERQ